MEKKYYFNINLSQQQFLSYYQGSTRSIQVFSACGKRLRFPASRLRPFLTGKGIIGHFVLTIDENNRFVRLQQL